MQKSKVVTTFIDDEDLLSDAGSGDDGSGLKNTAIYPDFYRIQFYITYISNTNGLSDRHSENFRRVSSDINTAISSLYNKAVRVSVYKYELKEQGAIVSLDLGTRENVNELVIKGLLSTQLKTGRLGNFRVSDEGFSFRPLGDTSCPTEVGRKPTQLAWTGENLARLMVNNMFPCDGYVTGWAYYVSRPTETFAATIWRPVDEFKFYLLSKHLLPATQMGYNEFTLSNHVKVEKGDFIGLHYPKSATSGAIAGSTRDRSDVPAAELYEVYTGELFDEQMSVNAEFNMKWLNFQKTRASFAIQAKMNYSGIADTFPPIEECAENEFKCRDGTCIQKNYYCDHQLDCPDGSDEENCGAGCQPYEFRCRSGDCVPYTSYCDNLQDCEDGSDEEDCPLCAATEFRCGDGTCVNKMKRCDSHADCSDASDEYGCANRTCSDAHYRCNTGQCIPVNLVCDNKRDCPDGSDEVRQACDFVCKPGGFKCNDGSCIREEQKCDRNPDCSDGSDELNCDTVCRLGEFRCQNGDCIPESRRCDSFLDCRDATDEFNCRKLN
ncbi:Low-density lipoprotein receptor 1,Low-density lipoprotein receptor-related protein 1B,Low-density lipoprotein receptor-related protein 2,Prolow-density lipoprotein receptor-related protein 1,Very low-density lipoprotein receptor,Low-density lipoprotein receptor 2,Low-density lipoprotein receptor-related protein 4,Low-density lipoprotein receptor-related protein 1,Low-density lipoprotein receptor-related protein 8,Low-density lipoprotein receptor,Sortilin-related receptor,Low-density lipoprotein receptor-r|uniref:Uncharacterized protein n=1 Tax=Acanthosepion pharaonis TaxID=158019 RepID=A0A812DQI1_ACAPH|nr:Low-density lipoprotein receptor 1,Low-density lipoprotein receptor-related protein 1B,Low-density lipoprotein receptor-related protein 2,Prolow-density lipoprotein receptor-related protein 1,Very low-density lipoprotein receptor,Low-density lipoprotein receptor 2,Low-density lipoprotein receptor-related protein 4,Low-density lipoprotein receptor-related protein 1,Low-density lipoprotein receptor-related protein 8,Low-density lipoprotein receptor,Sortilin-related receptor,Low-density lipoprotein